MTKQTDLVSAGAATLREKGPKGVTFRNVAHQAGAPSATVQYRFKTKKRMLSECWHEVVRQDRDRFSHMAAWLPPKLAVADVQPLVRLATAYPSADGVSAQPAFAELILAAIREQPLRSVLTPWLDDVASYWRNVTRAIGADPKLAGYLVELHLGLTIFGAPLKRQGLFQLVNDEALHRLLGRAPDATPTWYHQALAEAALVERQLMPIRDSSESYDRILAVSAALARNSGAAAVTYQRVAEMTGVSISAVTHYFPSRRHLLYAAYRQIQSSLNAYARQVSSSIPNYDIDTTIDIVLHSPEGEFPLFVAYAESELLSLHDDRFVDLSMYLRMSRGRTGEEDAIGQAEVTTVARFAAFANSIWLLGCTIRFLLTQEKKNKAVLREAIVFGFRRLGLA